MFAEGYQAQARLYAKGRLKTGQMNKTEKAFATYLRAEKQAGRVSEFWFECFKFKIADGTCWLTPDFVVLRPDGELQLYDTKGSLRIWTEDSKVKMKVCASNYPFRVFVVVPRAKKSGGGWEVHEVAADKVLNGEAS